MVYLLQSVLLGALVVFNVAVAAPAIATDVRCPPVIGESGVQVRLPPSFDDGASSEGWIPFYPTWYYKPWNMVFASNPANLALRNFQYDPTPVDPANPTGQVNDLGSFQVPNNDTVYTTYGVDTPSDSVCNVFNYAGTGILAGATSEYSVLAWGCDEDSLPYYVNYATKTELTQTPAGIDIMSTTDTGMDQKTLDAVLSGLKALGNQEISDMADGMQPMTNDGGRDGMPRVNTCDDVCKSNQNLLAILG
ncbi:hypothetical protein K458DRAFT_296754 [Lentithecium fluviatile CBS 122367]|uniref:Uncharacterized protein n=1 Tax=Lentithecium fluviatile CBS 122367 TaxID=1168545 RepID=A0A6G1J969_9PLEO|nr:hypothetical protein K458DRAFT_296754 [Lentithecium fluviatile CBS 122367]